MLRRLLLCLACLSFLASARAAEPLAVYTDEWPPISFEEDGEVKGMAVELVQQIQRRLHAEQPVRLLPWARAYNFLLTRPNVLLFVLGRTPEREKLMTMVGPVATSAINLYCRKGEALALRRLGDKLQLQPLTAFRSSIFLAAAKRHGFLNIVESADPEQSALMLQASRVAMWSEGDSVVGSVMRKAGLPADAVELLQPLEKIDLYLAFSRGTDREAVQAWEQALREMKRDGSFRKIYLRWLPGAAPPMLVERAGIEP
ncbi:substrate-binding periplasmic protein [Chromobacterium alticapitis]|uniref:ABC transporter substrate-binding protein n=1 Tax=Chromobacterium alticapitis TaxID=2073169 RepID=A0A2S5DH52_9NEIS|nr:transporter substrate-binding domain-containing protein [Chromobacterium alticapitis]POZ62413.1 ABC transporter substrate-binding protein [Chromobacterium alticapitis]